LVGDVVQEFEGERVEGRYLEREQEGEERSWCSWCDRVVLSKKDLSRWTRTDKSHVGDALGRSCESDLSSSSSL